MHYIQESKFFAKDTSNKTPDLQLNVVGVVVAGRGGGWQMYMIQKDRFFCPGVGFEPSYARVSSFHWFFRRNGQNPLNGGKPFFLTILFYLSQTKSQSLYNQGCPRWVIQSNQQKILVTSLCLLSNLAEV